MATAQPKPQTHSRRASDAMWHEYTNATTAHLNLQLDVYMAVASEDGQREAALNDLLIVAEDRRRAAREAIRHTEEDAT
jgi:hypothetical protein